MTCFPSWGFMFLSSFQDGFFCGRAVPTRPHFLSFFPTTAGSALPGCHSLHCGILADYQRGWDKLSIPVSSKRFHMVFKVALSTQKPVNIWIVLSSCEEGFVCGRAVPIRPHFPFSCFHHCW